MYAHIPTLTCKDVYVYVTSVCVYVCRYGCSYDSQMRICMEIRIRICVGTDRASTCKCVSVCVCGVCVCVCVCGVCVGVCVCVCV